jgi:hypothetical protein
MGLLRNAFAKQSAIENIEINLFDFAELPSQLRNPPVKIR